MSILRSWHEIAIARGAQPEIDGSMNGSEYARVGVAILNGCPRCQEVVAPYNGFQIADDNPYAYCRSCAVAADMAQAAAGQ